MATRGLAYHNRPPANDPIPETAPPEYVKTEFARRLSALLRAKGWNQSELARQAEQHLPEGKRFGRDNISNYVRGEHLPGPVHLDALCKALRVQPEDLLPPHAAPSADDVAPPLDTRDLGDGTVWMRINQRVTWEKALKLLNILKGEN